MVDTLKTIAAIIDIAAGRGITGAQALALLAQIRDLIEDEENRLDLEAEAEAAAERDEVFLKELGPPPGTRDDGLCPVCHDDVSEPADGSWHCLACGHRWL